MSILTLSKKDRVIKLKNFEFDNPIAYEYFNSLSNAVRDEYFFKAINIGVLALEDDRLSTFLAKTNNELGTELESLKKRFEMKQTVLQKSAIKGVQAEIDIASHLNEYFKTNKLSDQAILSGNKAGKLEKNKTGDIICSVNAENEAKIAIEVKFDKSIALGDIKDRDVFVDKKMDTTWNQLIEASANRDCPVSIIVLDISSVNPAVKSKIENVRFISGVGFITIVDSLRGDYSNLNIAYHLARDIAIKARPIKRDDDMLENIVNRIIKDLTDICTIEKLVTNNINNNKTILKQLKKSMITMNFTRDYLELFLEKGNLTREELHIFYSGHEINDTFKANEIQIDKL